MPNRVELTIWMSFVGESSDQLTRRDAKSMSVVELVAILLSESEADVESARGPASQILKSAGGILHIADVLPATLAANGLTTEFQRLKFYVGIELGRRAAKAGIGDRKVITGPEDVAELMSHLRDARQEHFCCVLLDAKKHLIRVNNIHVGTLTMSVVGVREFFRDAIIESADTVIAVHNHPSGDPTPSGADIEVTRQLMQAGEILGIPLIDHVIVAHGSFKSLHRLGLMS